jgi:hypothetical protein
VRGESHQYSQIQEADQLEDFIRESTLDRQLVFIVTTNPERGHEWLQRMLDPSKHRALCELVKSKKALFFLPQSPNPNIKAFAEFGTVIISDYYMGAGNISHDMAGRTSYAHAGVKENCRYAVVPATEANIEFAKSIMPALTFKKKLHRDLDPIQLALLPTNAILHSVGVACHIASSLIDIGVVREDALEAKTSQEFFLALHEGVGRRNIQNLVGRSLEGKSFYREMPQIGPNIIMDDISRLVTKIRTLMMDRGYMPASTIDAIGADGRSQAHMFHHLRGKYRKQYQKSTGNDPFQISFAEFVNNNPPYQNINFITNKEGRIDTGHRFFIEEIPTLLMLYKLGKSLEIDSKELSPLKLLIQFNQRVAQKRYLDSNNNLGSDAPAYLADLKKPEDFSALFNGFRGKGR